MPGPCSVIKDVHLLDTKGRLALPVSDKFFFRKERQKTTGHGEKDTRRLLSTIWAQTTRGKMSMCLRATTSKCAARCPEPVDRSLPARITGFLATFGVLLEDFPTDS